MLTSTGSGPCYILCRSQQPLLQQYKILRAPATGCQVRKTTPILLMTRAGVYQQAGEFQLRCEVEAKLNNGGVKRPPSNWPTVLTNYAGSLDPRCRISDWSKVESLPAGSIPCRSRISHAMPLQYQDLVIRTAGGGLTSETRHRLSGSTMRRYCPGSYYSNTSGKKFWSLAYQPRLLQQKIDEYHV